MNILWSHGPIILDPPPVTLPLQGNTSYDTCFHVTVSDTTCSATDTACVTVIPSPTSDFTINDTNLCKRDSITLTYTGTGTPSANYNWNFDGDSVSGQSPHVRQFNSIRKKTISLMVNENGCQSSQKTVKTVNVHPYPSVSFVPQPMGTCFGDSISFSNQSSPSSAKWLWNFGDGFTSSKQNPSHYYQAPGKYFVSLKAITKYGCTDSLTDNPVKIFPDPIASIDYQWIGSDEIIYSDVSTPGASTYNLTGRQWTFGSAASPQTSQDSSVHVTYSSPETFETKLIVNNNTGCSDTSIFYTDITSIGAPETETGIEIYPNPSPGIVNIEIPDSIDHSPKISV